MADRPSQQFAARCDLLAQRLQCFLPPSLLPPAPRLSASRAANGFGFPDPPPPPPRSAPAASSPSAGAAATPPPAGVPPTPETKLSCPCGHTSCFGTSGTESSNSSSISSTRSN